MWHRGYATAPGARIQYRCSVGSDPATQKSSNAEIRQTPRPQKFCAKMKKACKLHAPIGNRNANGIGNGRVYSVGIPNVKARVHVSRRK